MFSHKEKVIHLESELSYFRANHDGAVQNYIEQLNQVKYENDVLKRDMQRLIKENERLMQSELNPKLISKQERERTAKHLEEKQLEKKSAA